MSMEDAINNHAAAIRELATALNAKAVIDDKRQPTAKQETSGKFVLGDTSGRGKKPGSSTVAAAAADSSSMGKPPVQTESDTGKTLDYDKDVKPMLVKLVTKKGRETLAALLGEFGVDHGSKIPVGHLAAVALRAQELTAA